MDQPYPMTAPAAPMKQFATLAAGLLVVFFDFQVNGLDLVPDPLGWGIAAFAAASLARSRDRTRPAAPPRAQRWFLAVAVASAVAVLPSALQWIGVAPWAVDTVVHLASVVVVFAACTGIMATVPTLRSSANVVRWANIGAGAATLLLLMAVQVDDMFAGPALVMGMITLGVFVWFVVLLFRASGQPLPPAETPAAAH